MLKDTTGMEPLQEINIGDIPGLLTNKRKGIGINMYQYRKGKTKKECKAPFEIKCSNCGSHNVTVTAFEYRDLEIRCRSCGNVIDDIGTYNEMNYMGYIK